RFHPLGRVPALEDRARKSTCLTFEFSLRFECPKSGTPSSITMAVPSNLNLWPIRVCVANEPIAPDCGHNRGKSANSDKHGVSRKPEHFRDRMVRVVYDAARCGSAFRSQKNATK